jgi:ribonuclease PH
MEVDKVDGPKMRAIASELNFLTRSDGSAIVTQGLIKIFTFNFPVHIFDIF